MRHLSRQVAVGLTTSMLGVLCSLYPAQAFTFDQQEVSQEKFIAIAVPLAQGNSHNLLILEQVSSEKKCWQEDPAQPGVVDPLLLNFDFTGICGRSTDSNGYSIRVAGKDLGLDYKLSVRQRGGALKLIGYSYKDPRAPELHIGRTIQTGSGFLKIDLEPGWRFAKRAYDGKTLGHIYLTRDTFPETTAALEITPADQEAPLKQEPKTESGKTEIAVVDSSNIKSDTPALVPPKTSPSKGKQRNSRKTSSRAAFVKPIQIPVPRVQAPKASRPLLVPPKTSRRPFPSTNNIAKVGRMPSSFTTPIQIPVPKPNQPVTRAPRQYQAPAVARRSGDLPTLSPDVLPVPNGTIPLGNASNRSNVYRGLPTTSAPPSDGSPPAPPTRVAQLKHRYRVVVERANSSQQNALRSLVPDAFRSTYRGQSVLQVGAYETQEKADEMVRFLAQKGFDGVLEKR